VTADERELVVALVVAATALVETGSRLWSTSHNNTPSAHNVHRWMRDVEVGHFVLEITDWRAPALDRVGELLSITSGHEYTIRTIDDRELRWENADFVRVPRDAADNRAISQLGAQSLGISTP
jgi:hypothetical protein